MIKLGLQRAGDPRAGAHRRHLADRARGDAPHAAAHPRDDARVALSTADERLGPRDAHDGAHRHRRRNPRRGADQARRAPGAHARAARRQRRAARSSASACPRRRSRSRKSRRFLVGNGDGAGPESRSSPANAGVARSGHARRTTHFPATRHGTQHREHRPRPRTRHQPGDAGGAARGGDVGRGVGHGLRPAREAHRTSTTPRWCSRTRAAWSSASRAISPNGSAKTASPRTTAASPRKPASTPSSASRPARSR